MQAVATNSSSYCCAPIVGTVPGGGPYGPAPNDQSTFVRPTRGVARQYSVRSDSIWSASTSSSCPGCSTLALAATAASSDVRTGGAHRVPEVAHGSSGASCR
jgi:hypothetical protein